MSSFGREPYRIGFCFALLGVLALALCVRLVQVQGFPDPRALERERRQRLHSERLPAQRGEIRDRDGVLLAGDHPVLEVRARAATVIRDRDLQGLPDEFVRRLAQALAQALAADPEHGDDPGFLARETQRLEARLRRIRARPERDVPLTKTKGAWQRWGDFLVSAEVYSVAALEALQVLARDLARASRSTELLQLDVQLAHRRVYPEGSGAQSPVGHLSDRDRDAAGRPRNAAGLEANPELHPAPDAAGRRYFQRDARLREYFLPAWVPADEPVVVETTLDLTLQREAQRLLEDAAGRVAREYDAPPDWGALVLVEVETGDVLAMASLQTGKDGKPVAGARFNPTQATYQPGSVVKPLLFAVALERGVLRWDESIDCAPESGKSRFLTPWRRRVTDEHPSDAPLSPHDILVRSSNIGAGTVGLRLGREGIEEYLNVYGFGRATQLGMPAELAGRRPQGVLRMKDPYFSRDTACSVSYGYELNATPAQMARAFLTLVSGRPRELRVYRAFQRGGERQELPPRDAGTRPYLSEGNLALILGALGDVVSDDPHATGRALFQEIRKLGFGPGVLAGKTGTSEQKTRDGHQVRSASFAGFAPAAAPRYLAFGVLQKERANSFWGGKFAAPMAGRLLLAALERESQRRLQERARVGTGSEAAKDTGSALVGTATPAHNRGGR